jgi:regulator of protease activity HflC (stomatin/prohibitin superfamily)
MFGGFGGLIFFLFIAGLVLVSLFRTVEQSTVAVITLFGKYHRVMREGLNIKWPWEKVAYRLSLQNRALQLESRPSPRIRPM